MRSPFVLPNSKDPLRLDWGDEASHSCVAFSIVIFPMFVFTTEWDADFGIVDFGTLRISESGRFSFGSGRPWRPSSTAPRWTRKPARPYASRALTGEPPSLRCYKIAIVHIISQENVFRGHVKVQF